MTNLIIASALFFLIHSCIAGTGLRFVLIDKIGQKAYLGLFALASLGSIAWMVRAYNDAPYSHVPVLGDLPPAVDWLTFVLMFFALVLAVVGLTTKNPTATGQEAVLESEEPAKGIVRVTRHPFLVGVALWAFAHMLSNGELASLIFFGTFLIVVLLGMRNIDRKRARVAGEAWERFAAKTSRTPFKAIIQGRNTFNFAEIGVGKLAAGVAAFGLIFYFHSQIFGVAAGMWVTGAPGLG